MVTSPLTRASTSMVSRHSVRTSQTMEVSRQPSEPSPVCLEKRAGGSRADCRGSTSLTTSCSSSHSPRCGATSPLPSLNTSQPWRTRTVPPDSELLGLCLILNSLHKSFSVLLDQRWILWIRIFIVKYGNQETLFHICCQPVSVFVWNCLNI